MRLVAITDTVNELINPVHDASMRKIREYIDSECPSWDPAEVMRNINELLERKNYFRLIGINC